MNINYMKNFNIRYSILIQSLLEYLNFYIHIFFLQIQIMDMKKLDGKKSF